MALLRLSPETIETVACSIAAEYERQHTGRSTWNKAFGRYIVYGFENSLSFLGSTELCSVLQEARRRRKDIKLVTKEFFTRRFGIKARQTIPEHADDLFQTRHEHSRD